MELLGVKLLFGNLLLAVFQFDSFECTAQNKTHVCVDGVHLVWPSFQITN